MLENWFGRGASELPPNSYLSLESGDDHLHFARAGRGAGHRRGLSIAYFGYYTALVFSTRFRPIASYRRRTVQSHPARDQSDHLEPPTRQSRFNHRWFTRHSTIRLWPLRRPSTPLHSRQTIWTSRRPSAPASTDANAELWVVPISSSVVTSSALRKYCASAEVFIFAVACGR